MSKRNPSTDEFYRKLMQATSATGQAHFQKDPSEKINVNIRPDESISPGMFKPDPLQAGHYKAHPTTIKALRKDIFVGGQDEFIDLEKTYICNGCKRELDLQFWSFCPFCEAPFPKDVEAL